MIRVIQSVISKVVFLPLKSRKQKDVEHPAKKTALTKFGTYATKITGQCESYKTEHSESYKTEHKLIHFKL